MIVGVPETMSLKKKVVALLPAVMVTEVVVELKAPPALVSSLPVAESELKTIVVSLVTADWDQKMGVHSIRVVPKVG